VELDGGTVKTEVLSHEEIEGIRKRSRAGNNGPWVTDWCEMAKKTAFRRATKWLPLSAEIRDAFERDDDVIEGVATQRWRPATFPKQTGDRPQTGDSPTTRCSKPAAWSFRK
jgi:recombination protein RecT